LLLTATDVSITMMVTGAIFGFQFTREVSINNITNLTGYANKCFNILRGKKLLGPRGLMPNPKVGTVTFEVDKAVRDIKAGKIEYRVDRQGNLHLILGKKSFGEKELLENYVLVLEEIIRVKPAAAKGRYMKSITLSISMGPGVKVDPMVVRDILAEAEATA